MHRPYPAEHKPYFQRYIDLVPHGNFAEVLRKNTEEAIAFYKSIPAEKHDYRYAEGKWTVKEVLLHVTDTERLFSYRALVAGRGDNNTLLPVIDENLFAQNADVSNRSMDNLIDEFAVVRTAAAILFLQLTEEQSQWLGNNEGQPISARACAYIMMGHTLHHINVIKERYL